MSAPTSPPSEVTVLEAALDPAWLTEHCGRPVRASRLRLKPGVSLALSLVDACRGTPVGWARFLWPRARSRARSLAAWAGAQGLAVHQRDWSGLVLQWGGLASDPALGRVVASSLGPWAAALPGLEGPGGTGPGGAVAEAPCDTPAQGDPPAPGDLPGRRGAPGAEGTLQVMRHNPLRRLVIRAGSYVVRLSARPTPWGLATLSELAALVPTPPPVELPTSPAPGLPAQVRGEGGVHVAAQALTGDTDLGRCPDPEATYRAGTLLARLHRARPAPGGALEAALGPAPDAGRALRAHAGVLDHLDRALAGRARALVGRLPRSPVGPGVLSHGDASPDQVLLERASGLVWLTDFDRLCLAGPATDLGSYLSQVGPELGQALLDGYRAGGGLPPGPAEREAALTRSLVLRAAEPLRAADPAWRQALSATLEDLEERCP